MKNITLRTKNITLIRKSITTLILIKVIRTLTRILKYVNSLPRAIFKLLVYLLCVLALLGPTLLIIKVVSIIL